MRRKLYLYILKASLLAGFVNNSYAAESDNCVSLNRLDRTEVVDNQTILFHMKGKKTLVNNLPRRCPGLSFHKAFSYKTSIGRLCKQDVIRVFEGSHFGAACMLGVFDPYIIQEEDQQKPG